MDICAIIGLSSISEPTTIQCLNSLKLLWWDIRGVEASDDQSLKLFSSQLPSLAVFLVNAVLLPYLIDRESHFERNLLRSDAGTTSLQIAYSGADRCFVERSALIIHAIFLFINVVLLPTFALKSIEAFVHSKFTSDLSHWRVCFLLASIIAPSSLLSSPATGSRRAGFQFICRPVLHAILHSCCSARLRG
jgi:hypothetical protein